MPKFKTYFPSSTVKGLQVAVGRAGNRQWIKSVTGLKPAITKVARAINAEPIDVQANETVNIATASRNGLRKACAAFLTKVPADAKTAAYVQTILDLTAPAAPAPEPATAGADSENGE